MKETPKGEWRNETGKERKPTEGGLSSLLPWWVTGAYTDREAQGNGVDTCPRVNPPEGKTGIFINQPSPPINYVLMIIPGKC